MIPEKQQIKISKFLSLVLRHQPETIGIKLDYSGWTNVADLLAKMKENGHNLDLETLEYIVEHNPKKRFAFNDDRKMIRANQGHSVQVELGYEPQDPAGGIVPRYRAQERRQHSANRPGKRRPASCPPEPG